MPYSVNTAAAVFVSGYGQQVFPTQTFNPSTGLAWNSPLASPPVYGGAFTPSFAARSVEQFYECRFDLDVSPRIVSDVRESFELGAFAIKDTKSLDAPEE
jgi:hypothetical protein